jgi:hypothetical protein
MPTIFPMLDALVLAEHGPAGVARLHALDPDRHRHESAPPTAAQLNAYMSGLAALRGTPEGNAWYWAGEGIAPQLLRQFPQMQRKYTNMRSLLLNVNAVPGLGVQDLVPDAEIPYFDVELMGADTIRLIFTGSVESRELLEGLILGCARAYEERVVLASPLPLPSRPDRRVTDVTFEDERRAASRTATGGRTTGTPPRPR